MHVLLYVRKGGDGTWRIAAESRTPMSRPVNTDTITAAKLVEDMEEAGARYGLVASMAYDFADGPETPGERALVQAENDWTVRQAAQFPGRLVVFCGVHPFRSYAIAEVDRCARMPQVRGIKLHLHNRVDLSKPDDVEKLRAFFAAANARRLPVLVHLPVDFSNGSRHARPFLERVLPAAPDIPIQIAHLGGGNVFRLGAADSALRVFADAAVAGSPAMKNVYFDVTGSVSATQPAATLDTLAARLRVIGLRKILFGSDLPFFPLLPVGPAWAQFRRRIPLTNAELRVVADNVAPYVR
jgi:predicted TIM-barrel fold metal-dependent hydrolase